MDNEKTMTEANEAKASNNFLPVLNKTFLRIPLRILYKFHRLSSLRTLEDGPLGTGSFGNDAHLFPQKIGSKTFAEDFFAKEKGYKIDDSLRIALEFGDLFFSNPCLVFK